MGKQELSAEERAKLAQARLQVAGLALSLILTVLVMTPPAARELWRLRALNAAQKTARRLATFSGRHAIALEARCPHRGALAPPGMIEPGYELTALISAAAEHCAALYARARAGLA
jgi:hypothetical protein